MRLFKYRPPSDTHILEKATLRFSPPSEFNDAFEFLPSVLNFDSDFWKTTTGQILEPGLALSYAQIEFSQRSLRYRSYEHYKREFMKDLFANTEEFKARMINAVMGVTRSGTFGVLCLSMTAPDHVNAGLLWGHYAKDHEGFAVEFDHEHEFVRAHEAVKDGPMTAGKVDYSRVDRPVWDQNAKILEFMYRKSPAWGYEQEYRMTRILNTPALAMKTDHKGLTSIAGFSKDFVIGITFGVRCLAKTKRNILAALQKNNFPKAKIWQAKFHDHNYCLDVIPFDASKHLLE